jgi:uncharacterized RDD family membrane protein YckC/DNA-binding HxlR family transcriptional regulator
LVKNKKGSKLNVAVYEDSVSKILSILSHPLRRDILSFINEKGECTFTDLLNVLEVDTGKLSFHLRTLSTFTEQTPRGKYKLSKTGERALRVIRDVEGWAEGADISRKAARLPYASFRSRSLAFLFDAGLMFLVAVLFASTDFFRFLLGGAFVINLSAMPFITLGLLFVYSTLLEGFNGQTLGKRLEGLKVVRLDGKKLTYEHSAVRNFGKTFLLPFDLLVELREKTTMRYFDKFAGTTVIDLRAPLKAPTATVEKRSGKIAENSLEIEA